MCKLIRELICIFREGGDASWPAVCMEGEVTYSSPQILVVDLLMDAVSLWSYRYVIDLDTGIFVYKAHGIIETSQETFI